jgi:hypothetical protein
MIIRSLYLTTLNVGRAESTVLLKFLFILIYFIYFFIFGQCVWLNSRMMRLHRNIIPSCFVKYRSLGFTSPHAAI